MTHRSRWKMTTESDLRKRKNAVDFANASSGLSGVKITEDMENLAQDYINGEVDLDEFLSLALPEILPTSAKPESTG
jgi:hypothetical protein